MFKTYETIFQERADSYHAAMTACPDARQAEFRYVLEPLTLRAGDSLCDLPAGAGYLWDYVRGASVRYYGVEPSRMFASLFPSDPGAVSLHAAMTALPFGDGQVNHLVSLAGLHHEPDLPSVFGEMRRVLRAGGTAVIVDVQAGTGTDRFLNGFVADHNPMSHDGIFLDERSAPALVQAGFEVRSDEVRAIPWMFANREEMGRFLRPLFGATLATPEQVAEAAEELLGVREHDAGIGLAWPLRRLVCRAA